MESDVMSSGIQVDNKFLNMFRGIYRILLSPVCKSIHKVPGGLSSNMRGLAIQILQRIEFEETNRINLFA